MSSGNGRSEGLYILLLSVHGLIRGEEMELGRDADTGGQTKYVVELAKALARNPAVERVDLVTRQVFAKKVDESYQQAVEKIADKARIIRIPFGPRRYLRKEKLWPYLDTLTDQTLSHLRQIGRTPDIVHGHYADAGYVGSQLARLLGVPFVFTGHSLGRVKQERLMEKGRSKESLEKKFNFRVRFEAEETSLDTAALVVASTHQEIEQQYELYDHYVPSRMQVIPPGVNLDNFSPPDPTAKTPEYLEEIKRFLKDPDKPMVLAIARPDERKNFPTLLKAFAELPELREKANLVIIAGNRKNLSDIDAPSRKVLRTLMFMIDEYNLYGSVAYPKEHKPQNVPELYRIAASTGGVFVNPAYTEPFGLTLIEAAASGLPIIAPNDGGPRDIIGFCKNGQIIDPHDSDKMGQAILEAVTDKKQWKEWSNNGIKKSRERYSWDGHVTTYIEKVNTVIGSTKPDYNQLDVRRTKLTTIDRFLVTSIKEVLTGDPKALKAFLSELEKTGDNVGFCVATSKKPEQAMKALRELEIPMPDVLITTGGSEIYYGRWLVPDRAWQRHIDYKWRPEAICEAMEELPDLRAKDESSQGKFRLGYELIQPSDLNKRKIVRHLRQKGLRTNVIFSYEKNIDILPIRSSTGLAIRHLVFKWGVPPDRLLVAGYSGGEEEMLTGSTLGVVVGPPSPEIRHLRDKPRIYFTEGKHAWGLLEGIRHYNFFGDIRIPSEEEHDFEVGRVTAAVP